MGRRLRTLAKFISIIFSLVTLVSAAGPLPAARSELATSGSDASSTVAQSVFSDGSDFIGTPEEIYQKVKARRDSLGLFNHTTTLEARNKVHTLIALPFQSPSLENNEADAFESDRCILFSVCLSRAGAGEKQMAAMLSIAMANLCISAVASWLVPNPAFKSAARKATPFGCATT